MINLEVSGHRFLLEESKIVQGIEAALDAIEAAFSSPSFRVVSQLGEGADRLAVREILKRENSRLLVPLPLPVDDYLTDFLDPASRADFYSLYGQAEQVIHLPPAPSREESYARAGSYILANSEVFLVIWDGNSGRGTGGTGALAAAARQRGLPLAWVLAGNRVPGTNLPTSLGEQQGMVRFENFPN